jgi:ACR3 family arsenite efflux pump ArsB
MISSDWVVTPVMLPPGLARLATNPEPTALLTLVMTIGMVAVARCSARVVVALPTTITSTFGAISLLANRSK